MEPETVTLFLCGDVMTGRGIDHVLPHPSDPRLYEPYVRSDLEYVGLAESANGPIPRPLAFDYIWGDALPALTCFAPDARIINLETSVTTSEDYEHKGINYRMHPANIPCLTAAGIDCCVLANNHVLDWGVAGLTETLDVLRSAGLETVGAGRNLEEAFRPAMLHSRSSKILVFAAATIDSGTPKSWAAGKTNPGVVWLPGLSIESAECVAQEVRRMRGPGDLVVFSIHWGGNWGYRVLREQQLFAHRLIDRFAADIVHGHSSHHPKAIEVYRNKLILYGCGDFLNDYEGISGYEQFHSDIVLMYFVTLNRSTGDLARLEMVPLATRRFRLQRATAAEAEWIRDVLAREGRKFGAGTILDDHARLQLLW